MENIEQKLLENIGKHWETFCETKDLQEQIAFKDVNEIRTIATVVELQMKLQLFEAHSHCNQNITVWQKYFLEQRQW